MVSSKFELYYFPIQGRAETAHLILEHAGAPYENTFVKNWAAEKPKTPLGMVPVLRVIAGDGHTVEIAESHAIERYLARELGLLGSTSLEAAVLEMYHEAWIDLGHMYVYRVIHASNDEEKKKGLDGFWVKAAAAFKFHEAILKKKGPFYGGSKITLPDISAFHQLNRIINKSIPSGTESFTEESYPHLFALWKGVRESKAIKEYMESERYVIKRPE